MIFIKYVIINNKGQGLQYINGSLYWTNPVSLSCVEDFTSFKSEKLAAAFITDRSIKEAFEIKRITIETSF